MTFWQLNAMFSDNGLNELHWRPASSRHSRYFL